MPGARPSQVHDADHVAALYILEIHLHGLSTMTDRALVRSKLLVMNSVQQNVPMTKCRETDKACSHDSLIHFSASVLRRLRSSADLFPDQDKLLNACMTSTSIAYVCMYVYREKTKTRNIQRRLGVAICTGTSGRPR